MAYYMIQAKYGQPNLEALVKHPQNRTAAARTVIEAHGGTLHQFFLSFGEYDMVAIAEFPDNESATAAILAVAAAGAVSDIKTTVLVTAEEGERAMSRAGAMQADYRPPSG